MNSAVPHITVCICTFKRPELLARTLKELGTPSTNPDFTHSIVVVDNDAAKSGEPTVAAFRSSYTTPIVYCVEPEQNIALARNRALANATGDYVAFIDDDEVPGKEWLARMLAACRKYQVDGALGPVLPYFELEPPAWVVKGKFFDRPTHDTGYMIPWSEGRTGNVLFRRDIVQGSDEPFRREYGSGGEDRDFFRRMIGAGRRFVWCNEAPVHELVPSERWQRSFMLRRALLRGKMALNHGGNWSELSKSMTAVIGYSLALPVLFLLGQHIFMLYLIKACDHAGKLLAAAGVSPIRQKYVIE
jgi:succinoglycan biosynthesis protein ExoM